MRIRHTASTGTWGMVPHVLELDDKLLPQLLVDNGDLEAALVGQEVPVVGGLKDMDQNIKHEQTIDRQWGWQQVRKFNDW